jgi:hypothetical protein
MFLLPSCVLTRQGLSEDGLCTFFIVQWEVGWSFMPSTLGFFTTMTHLLRCLLVTFSPEKKIDAVNMTTKQTIFSICRVQ